MMNNSAAKKTLKQLRSENHERKIHAKLVKQLALRTGFSKQEVSKYYPLFEIGFISGLNDEGDS